VAAAAERPSFELPRRRWPASGQLALAHELAGAVGFDGRAGLIAESAHPFTNGNHRGDVRFTTRVDEPSRSATSRRCSTKAAHASTSRGCRSLRAHHPLRRAVARRARIAVALLENTSGAPGLLALGGAGDAPSFRGAMDGLAARRPAPGVRPGAALTDPGCRRQVTYNLHIVLRFELEVALMRGDLAVRDLPVRGRGLERLLGLRPPSDADGVMQDIHWADGLNRLLPDLHARQPVRGPAHRAFAERHADVEGYVERGSSRPARLPARARHRHGRRLETRGAHAPGHRRELGVDAFVAHLTAAYG